VSDVMTEGDRLAAVRSDLAYHQARVLLLVTAVANALGRAGKVDGLTKLAKLDFLVRYPVFAPRLLGCRAASDPRLNLSHDEKYDAESPMIRYKYGPWDDRYYSIVGGLVGRGLLSYARLRRGNVAVRPTKQGRALTRDLATSPYWRDVYERCELVAESVGDLSGTRLKELIYDRLPEVVDRPHREVIRQ